MKFGDNCPAYFPAGVSYTSVRSYVVQHTYARCMHERTKSQIFDFRCRRRNGGDGFRSSVRQGRLRFLPIFEAEKERRGEKRRRQWQQQKYGRYKAELSNEKCTASYVGKTKDDKQIN